METVRDQLQPFSKNAIASSNVRTDEDFVDDGFLQRRMQTATTLLSQASAEWGLEQAVVENLSKDGIDHMFPVQAAVIPQLIYNNAFASVHPRDMCVTAPTGSGKTIAYAVPILDYVIKGKVRTCKRQTTERRLVALILLPSRELAHQVHSVFTRLADGMNIGIALSTGQSSFAAEQAELVGGISASSTRADKRESHLDIYTDSISQFQTNASLYGIDSGELGRSQVDVLICTPGRLVDHLQFTPGFTLQHIRFLILDEADRLLSNAYQGWIPILREQLLLQAQSEQQEIPSAFYCQSKPLQRLLFSATLADNPRKLAMLDIRNPLLVRANLDSNANKAGTANADAIIYGDNSEITTNSSGFTLPFGLQELVCYSDTETRVLDLARLIWDMVRPSTENSVHVKHAGICSGDTDMVLIFASSIDATHRLCRLLQLMNGQLASRVIAKKRKLPSDEHSFANVFGGVVAEISSNFKQIERSKVMESAKNGCIKVLVCSDQLSRGIDLPNIRAVVNYDPPAHAKVYVHRAGRTARAHREGVCITLLRKGQGSAFKSMRKTIGHANVAANLLKCNLSQDSSAHLNTLYSESLNLLSELLDSEENGEVINELL